jgi:4-hydroxybenzoate polyprenyltransferase
MASISGYLRLLRWPGAVTAAANAVTGFLLVRDFLLTRGGADPAPRGVGFAIAGAAALIYLGGVALNDVADADRDREIHPDRPLPSGDAARGPAAVLALALLAGGCALALFVAGPAAGAASAVAAACAVLYDVGGKRWRVPGSLLMGGARAANATAGMLAAAVTLAVATERPGAEILAYPLAVGGYTVLLTFASTFEGRRPTPFLAGTLAVALVIPAAMAWPLFPGEWWWAPALPLLALAATLVSGARDAQVPEGPGLGALIRRAVFGFLLIDSAFLMGMGYYEYGFWLILFYVGLRFLLARLRS